MNSEKQKIEIRECATLEEFKRCELLQRKVFNLPDLEVSPVRHLVVTKSAGGFILGAFAADELVGFVLSVPAFGEDENFFYSHMTAVAENFQNYGIGAKLKWAQRTRALRQNVKIIKWTFQPVLARNAHFNLNRLGATIRKYIPNFYGTDYPNLFGQTKSCGIDSDRLYVDWNLESKKVEALAKGENFTEKDAAAKEIEVPNDWDALVKNDLKKAVAEQNRIKREFQSAFDKNLVCRAFERGEQNPKYLLYAN